MDAEELQKKFEEAIEYLLQLADDAVDLSECKHRLNIRKEMNKMYRFHLMQFVSDGSGGRRRRIGNAGGGSRALGTAGTRRTRYAVARTGKTRRLENYGTLAAGCLFPIGYYGFVQDGRESTERERTRNLFCFFPSRFHTGICEKVMTAPSESGYEPA